MEPGGKDLKPGLSSNVYLVKSALFMKTTLLCNPVLGFETQAGTYVSKACAWQRSASYSVFFTTGVFDESRLQHRGRPGFPRYLKVECSYETF